MVIEEFDDGWGKNQKTGRIIWHQHSQKSADDVHKHGEIEKTVIQENQSERHDIHGGIAKMKRKRNDGSKGIISSDCCIGEENSEGYKEEESPPVFRIKAI